MTTYFISEGNFKSFKMPDASKFSDIESYNQAIKKAMDEAKEYNPTFGKSLEECIVEKLAEALAEDEHGLPTGEIKKEEHQVHDRVIYDDVAAFAGEDDLLIYDHFYRKGMSDAGKKAEGSEHEIREILIAALNEKWDEITLMPTPFMFDFMALLKEKGLEIRRKA